MKQLTFANRNRRRPRLQLRLVNIVPLTSALLIIGILTILGFDLWRGHAQIVADGERTTRNLAHVLEEQTARTVQAIDLTIQSINDVIPLRCQNQPACVTEIDQLLRQKLATLPYVRAIFVIGADGFIIYDTDTGNRDVSLADRGYFKVHQDNPNLGLYIGPPLISRSVNTWFISMSRRFNNPDGTFGGVIVVAVEPQYFEQFYDTINVGHDGSIAIFKRDGTLMVRSPPADAMMGASFADNILFRDYLPKAEQGTLRTNSVIDGVLRVFSYRAIPELQLVVVIGISEQELLASWYNSVQIYALAGLAFTTAITMLTFLLVQQLRRREVLIAAVRASEERYRRIVETAQEGIWVLDAAGRTTFTNRRMAEMLGSTVASMQGRAFLDFLDDTIQADGVRYLQHVHGGHAQQRDFRFRTTHGKDLWAIVSVTPIMEPDAQVADGMELLVTDITSRRELEAQLQQTQKMESIGQLAGGIAHDFNNLLTAIISNADLACSTLPAAEPIAYELREIQQAADRAAGLTRQLLAFARKQTIELQVLNCNDLILNVDKLLRRLIGEHIELVIDPADDLAPIRADASQIEQLLMNLALNARDAMPNGGKLAITTRNAVLEATGSLAQPHVTPGSAIQITVSDTGAGMSSEVQARMFEPFFTTKELGKGTGLGLATCYGIVAQHGGRIEVASALGAGTTITISLPAEESAVIPMHWTEQTEALPLGTETILLVEDEVSVREVAGRILRAQGYTVLEAANGEEALWLVEARAGGIIDLLLTDMVMPRMGGLATAEQIVRLYPAIKVLFMSGYTGNTRVQQGALARPIYLLQKPFSPAALAYKVREILDQP